MLAPVTEGAPGRRDGQGRLVDGTGADRTRRTAGLRHLTDRRQIVGSVKVQANVVKRAPVQNDIVSTGCPGAGVDWVARVVVVDRSPTVGVFSDRTDPAREAR